MSLAQKGDFTNLFGAAMGYVGAGSGVLTNRLKEYHNKPAVVYLDEIDKVKDTKTLFGFYNLFVDGFIEHQTGKQGGEGDLKINCTQHIFIVTTNWGQDIISAWDNRRKEAGGVATPISATADPAKRRAELAEQARATDATLEAELDVLAQSLKVHIRERVLRSMPGTPPPTALMGRFDTIIPFVGFTPQEIKVVVNEQLNQIAQSFAKPKDEALTAGGPGRYVGGLRVAFSAGLRAAACDAYLPEDGMRSLSNFSSNVTKHIVGAYKAGIFQTRCIVTVRPVELPSGVSGKATVVERARDDVPRS